MKIRIAAATALALVTLTACSSSGDGGGGSDPVSTGGGSASQSAPMTTAPTDANTDTSSESSGRTDGPAAGSSSEGGDGASTSDFCTELKEELTKVSDLGTDMSDPAKAKDKIREMADVFSKLAGDAPAEVKAELQDLADVMSAAAKYLDDPSSGSSTAITNMTSKLPQDMQALSTYATKNCS